jgi:hypothetical protein
MKLFLTCLNCSRFIFLQNWFGQLFWPFLTSKNERQIAVRSPMIKNLKKTLIFEQNKYLFPKKFDTQIFQEFFFYFIKNFAQRLAFI